MEQRRARAASHPQHFNVNQSQQQQQQEWERQEWIRSGREAAEQFRDKLPVLSQDEIEAIR